MSAERIEGAPDEAALLSELRLLVLAQLRDILANGVADPKRTGAGAERAPAPAPYVAAAIRLLKECGALGDAGGALEPLHAQLPEFDDD